MLDSRQLQLNSLPGVAFIYRFYGMNKIIVKIPEIYFEHSDETQHPNFQTLDYNCKFLNKIVDIEFKLFASRALQSLRNDELCLIV
jgi:hypothetical protein